VQDKSGPLASREFVGSLPTSAGILWPGMTRHSDIKNYLM